METAPAKTRLLALLQEGHADMRSLADSVGEAEREASGTAGRWALKDLVFHVGFWTAVQVEQIAMGLRGETPPTYDNYLEINDQGFLKNRDRSWDDIWAEAERHHAALMASIEALSEEQLTDPQRYTWHPGQSIASQVQGTYWHTVIHAAQYYSDRGDLAQATRIQETLAAKLGGPGSSPHERGTAQYNLACFYATTGQPEKALAVLPEAFTLRPDLAEWAKKDTDLDSLRERAEYKALYP